MRLSSFNGPARSHVKMAKLNSIDFLFHSYYAKKCSVLYERQQKKREFPLQFPSPSSGSTIAESKFIQVYMRRAQCELKAIYFSWFSNSILIVSRFVGKIFFLNCTEITTTMQRFLERCSAHLYCTACAFHRINNVANINGNFAPVHINYFPFCDKKITVTCDQWNRSILCESSQIDLIDKKIRCYG